MTTGSDTKPRVLLFENKTELTSTFADYLTLQGFHVINLTGNRFFMFEPWGFVPLMPNHAYADIIIAHVDIPCEDFERLFDRQISHGWGVKGIALIGNSWAPECQKLAVKLGLQLLTTPLNLNELDAWLERVSELVRPDRILVDLPRPGTAEKI